jgi:uncharacterized Fe-S radical SAM superfamily protein PflX
MELIESLQGRVVEENVEELSEETDGSHEKLDEIADNVEICEVNCVLNRIDPQFACFLKTLYSII